MNWIEQWLGIAPDGGNGTLELLMLLIPLSAAALLWRMRLKKHNGRE
jgi:hypothetical protein